MNKIETLEYVRKVCSEEEITAYKISKETGLSTVGIQKILDGETKNPNKSTVDILKKFIDERNSKNKNPQDNLLKEPESTVQLNGDDTKIIQIEEQIKAREETITLATDKYAINHQKEMIKLLRERIALIKEAKKNRENEK